MAFCDLSDDWSLSDERADICVVGAGTAGLLLARRLARRNFRVILIESGGRSFDPSVQALNEIEDPARRYGTCITGRNRGLGGSPWSGCLIPINTTDGRARDYLAQPQWPIDLATLDRYRPELEDLFCVGHGSYDDIESDAPGASGLLIANHEDFEARWAKYPSAKKMDLTAILGEELNSSENLTVWLNATVTGFDLNKESGRLQSVTARNLAGKMLKVTADEFIFSAGTIESTRLLLWLDASADNRPFAGTDALGCYFQDQLQAEIASVDRQRSELTSHLLTDRFVRGTRRELHLELSRSAQERDAVASAFIFPSLSPPNQGTAIAQRVHHRAERDGIEAHQVGLAIRDVSQFATDALWRFWYHQRYVPPKVSFRLMSRIEQLADPLNRIRLAHGTDRLGVPRPLLEWEPRLPDERAFLATITRLGHYWERSGFDILCPLIWNPSAIDPTQQPIIDHARACAHPSGSTRMGTDPATSVVNADLRCHAIPNLAIASASVFPTSGSADPTLTLMQLALRLADSYAPAA
ncbi:MAG: GMC oxidoreductase [Devosia sp.]